MRAKIYLGILALLILANLVYQYSQWGLITLTVHDAPLSQVVRNIEWQSWTKIYTNIPTETKVTLYLDHATLPEAMQKLTISLNGSKNRPQGSGVAQWNLGFFIAPSAAEVRQEIHSFEAGGPSDGVKIYNYPSPMMILAVDLPAADPRRQSWPGATPPPPVVAGGDAKPSPVAPDQLQDLACSANIWILTPASWTPEAATLPPADASIVRAVQNFVKSAHGVLTQAIVLRGGWGDNRKVTDANWDNRMRNSISGLPAEAQPNALKLLEDEIKFQDYLQTVPPDQVHEAMVKHRADKILYSDLPLSPEMRAQRFQRMVAARAAENHGH